MATNTLLGTPPPAFIQSIMRRTKAHLNYFVKARAWFASLVAIMQIMAPPCIHSTCAADWLAPLPPHYSTGYSTARTFDGLSPTGF
eukprot:COSAG01_NODE_45866_length_405_cov_1.503268_1_plen_85_part_10